MGNDSWCEIVRWIVTHVPIVDPLKMVFFYLDRDLLAFGDFLPSKAHALTSQNDGLPDASIDFAEMILKAQETFAVS